MSSSVIAGTVPSALFTVMRGALDAGTCKPGEPSITRASPSKVITDAFTIANRPIIGHRALYLLAAWTVIRSIALASSFGVNTISPWHP